MSYSSRIDKVIEIVRRQHDNISDEHMIDILAIADQAATELAQLKLSKDYASERNATIAQLHKDLEEAIRVIEKDKLAMGRILLMTGIEQGDRRNQILEAHETSAAFLAKHGGDAKEIK